MAHSCVMSSPGVKGTITGWATDPTTTFDDPDRFKDFRGKRSSPSLRGHCIVCAAQRMVRFDVSTHMFCLFQTLFQFLSSLPSCQLVSESQQFS